MLALTRFYVTTVGKKFMMALTGIVLLGFVRGGGWNAYAHAEQLVDAAGAPARPAAAGAAP